VVASSGASVEAFLSEIEQWTDHTAPVVAVSTGGRSHERILIVDDNADMRAYITRQLASQWHVESAHDGLEALAAAQRMPPDLIVADVMMPRMDGLALVRALRADERTRTIPIVLLSARAGEEATIEGLASGADDYLIKPFSANELQARVAAQLSVARLRQEALLKAQAATRSREDTLAIVSHDLRTPLAAIRTAATLIKRVRLEGEQADRVRDRATMIERSVDAMDRLIADLLDISGLESGTLTIDKQPHAVGDIVAEIGELFGATAHEAGLSLSIEVADGAVLVSVDRHRIVQVLSNLVGNALKFTPPGGRIRVCAASTRDGVQFQVIDTGPGIAAETMNHIFDRYWHSSQEDRRGHGLGLSIAKGIVEAHGGTLRVETELGHGSTFSFVIPSALTDRSSSIQSSGSSGSSS